MIKLKTGVRGKDCRWLYTAPCGKRTKCPSERRIPIYFHSYCCQLCLKRRATRKAACQTLIQTNQFISFFTTENTWKTHFWHISSTLIYKRIQIMTYFLHTYLNLDERIYLNAKLMLFDWCMSNPGVQSAIDFG